MPRDPLRITSTVTPSAAATSVIRAATSSAPTEHAAESPGT